MTCLASWMCLRQQQASISGRQKNGPQVLPLLIGDAQVTALALPPTAQGSFPDLQQVILDRMEFSPEDYLCQFHDDVLANWMFVYTQCPNDAIARWLSLGNTAGEMDIQEKILLEKFMGGLPTGTLGWVLCFVGNLGRELPGYPSRRTSWQQTAKCHCPPSPSTSKTFPNDGRLTTASTCLPSTMDHHPPSPLIWRTVAVHFPTSRQLLRCSGKSFGGAGIPATSAVTVFSWRSDRWYK